MVSLGLKPLINGGIALFRKGIIRVSKKRLQPCIQLIRQSMLQQHDSDWFFLFVEKLSF